MFEINQLKNEFNELKKSFPNFRIFKIFKWLVIVILVFGSFSYLGFLAKQNSPNKDDAKLLELRKIAKSTEKFPGLIKIGEDYGSRGNDAGIYQYLKSDEDYRSVEKFYEKHFTEKGWIRDKEDKGLTFRKEKFFISIEFRKSKNAEWNYGISYV